MRILQWPQQERPREKLFHQGIASLSDAELLALFLRTGAKGKTAVDLARELLQHRDGLQGVLSAQFKDINCIKGIGKAKYCQLQAVLELGRRYWQETNRNKNPLLDKESLHHYLQTALYNPRQEVFSCLFLDNCHHIIRLEKLFTGTLTRASIYPREVVRAALQHNASAALFAHNHPSGKTTPSQADYEVTEVLCQALALIEVEVLDHLIIGNNMVDIVSLAEQGYPFGANKKT